MPPFWHGLNSFQRSIASSRLPSGIFSVAVNVPVFLISSTSMSTAPLAGRSVRGRVVHVVPAGRVVQPAHHVDAVGRQHEVAVVEIVLLGREHRDRRPRLLPRVGGLLRDRSDGGRTRER